MALFRKKKPASTTQSQASSEVPNPQGTKTTVKSALKADVDLGASGLANIAKGGSQILSGALGGVWHTYTSPFNQARPNQIGATFIAGVAAYAVAQEELNVPSLGEIYAAAKDKTCYVIPAAIEPARCNLEELSAIDLAVRKALTNG